MSVLPESKSLIFANSDASFAKIFHIDFKPSGKSFMQIKNKKEPKAEPCGIPASTC